jgi:acyl-CoA dehydrogenase
MSMNPDLHHCLTSPTSARTVDHVDDWLPQWRALTTQGHAPMALALRGGYAADRLAWAFSAGYQAALRALIGGAAPNEVLSLSVTEASGNRPRDIAARLHTDGQGGWRLSGHKRWASLAPCATRVLVVALDERGVVAPGDRPRLCVADVGVPSAGLTLRSMPPTPFVPEVPHGNISLDAVPLAASAVLPADGYEHYVKPFRTLEDTFVTAATLAYLLRESLARCWPQALSESLVGQLVTLSGLSAAPADDPLVHLALAGVLQQAATLRQQVSDLWAAETEAAAQRWRRDQGLFQVAAGPRAQRGLRAWQRLGR